MHYCRSIYTSKSENIHKWRHPENWNQNTLWHLLEIFDILFHGQALLYQLQNLKYGFFFMLLHHLGPNTNWYVNRTRHVAKSMANNILFRLIGTGTPINAELTLPRSHCGSFDDSIPVPSFMPVQVAILLCSARTMKTSQGKSLKLTLGMTFMNTAFIMASCTLNYCKPSILSNTVANYKNAGPKSHSFSVYSKVLCKTYFSLYGFFFCISNWYLRAKVGFL